MYDISFAPATERYLKKIKEKGLKEAFRHTLAKIAQDPYAGESNPGNLSGIFCMDAFYQGANYEIAYKVYEDDGNLVIVILAGSRENFYDELKRYM